MSSLSDAQSKKADNYIYTIRPEQEWSHVLRLKGLNKLNQDNATTRKKDNYKMSFQIDGKTHQIYAVT